MAFTSYAALLVSLQDDLASGQWRYVKYDSGGKEVQYASIDAFLKFFRYVEGRANVETGAAVGRTFARHNGRFPPARNDGRFS